MPPALSVGEARPLPRGAGRPPSSSGSSPLAGLLAAHIRDARASSCPLTPARFDGQVQEPILMAGREATAGVVIRGTAAG
eukprot:1197015-Rhodomonas_salina.1